MHVWACCSDPGWDLTQAAVLVGSFGDGCRGRGCVCVCSWGGCSYPESGSPRVGIQQGPSLCGGGFALLVVCPSTFFSCSGIASSPPKPFWLRGLLSLQSTGGRGGERWQELGPPLTHPWSWVLQKASLRLVGAAASQHPSPGGAGARGGRRLKAGCRCVPQRGALPGSRRASSTYGCHTARRSTGSRCCSNAGAGPSPFP